MEAYIIRIQRYDDLLTIQDKMAWGDSWQILLVFPNTHKIIKTRIDFSLIQRAARVKGKQIAAVIKDIETRSVAEESGLLVFDTIEKAKKSNWKKENDPRFEVKRRIEFLEKIIKLSSVRKHNLQG